MTLCSKEVAQHIGVSVRTAQRLLRSGEIRAMRIGPKLWRTTREEIERYKAARWNRPAA